MAELEIFPPTKYEQGQKYFSNCNLPLFCSQFIFICSDGMELFLKGAVGFSATTGKSVSNKNFSCLTPLSTFSNEPDDLISFFLFTN